MDKEHFQTNIDEIAERILGELMEVHSYFEIDFEKGISKYKDKLRKEFIAGLTDQQMRMYNQIEDLFIDELCVESSKYFLFGMQSHLAIEKLYNDPKTVLELFYKDTELTFDDTKLSTYDVPLSGTPFGSCKDQNSKN